MEPKICKKCEITKNKEDFYKHTAVCKLCKSEGIKEKCEYCSKLFVNLDSHEKTKHSDEEEFKYFENMLFYSCAECNNSFQLSEFNHYNDKCKKCYNDSRKKNKIECNKCLKTFNYYYFKNHKCLFIKNGTI